jgi:DNA end-binding protein Ku
MAALKASINFGLVNIPVELLTAEDHHREHSFHMLDSKDNSRIRYKRVNENTGREVDWDDIVKGIEVKDGKYIVFTEEDLKDLQSEANRNLEIDRFIDKDSVSPLLFETPYYLAPAKGGEKAYSLLERALDRSQKYGVVQAVLRGKQRIGLILSQDGVLVFETI